MKIEYLVKKELQFNEEAFFNTLQWIKDSAIDTMEDAFFVSTSDEDGCSVDCIDEVLPQEVYKNLYNSGIDAMIKTINSLKIK